MAERVLYKVILTSEVLEEMTPPVTIQAISKEKLTPIVTASESSKFYASATTREEAIQLATERMQEYFMRLCAKPGQPDS